MQKATSLPLTFHQFHYGFHGRFGLDELQHAAARFEFHLALHQRFLADAKPNWKAHQVRVLEFYAGTFIAVIQNHFHAARSQFRVNFLRQFHHRAVRRHAQRRDANGVGRDAQRPDDAVLVVALLDDRLQGSCDANAVAAHDGGLARTGLVEKSRAKLLAVFRAEFEDMANLDGPPDFQWFAAFRAGFTGSHSPQIEPLRHLDVAFDGDVAEMETVFVRTGGHVVRAAQPLVGINGNIPRLHSRGYSAETSRMRAERGRTFFRCRRPENRCAQSSGELRFLQLVVAADQNDNGFAVRDVNEGFDLAVGRNAVRRFAQRFDGDNAGRGKPLDFGFRISDFGFRRRAGGFLNIRGVTAGFAINHLVLAGFGGDHKLVRKFSADDAGVGFDRKRLQSAPRKDARISVVHFLVADLGRLVAHVEAVGVLHDELAGAHEAEARADRKSTRLN